MRRNLFALLASLGLALSSCVEPDVIPTANFETDFEIDYSFLQSNKSNLPKYLTFEPVRFLDKSTDGISYSWDFGNGRTSTEREPVVYFESAGEYIVKLTVTSRTGHESVIRQQVRIYDRYIDKITIWIQAWDFNLYSLEQLGWTQDKAADVVLEVGILGEDDIGTPSTILYSNDHSFKDFTVGSKVMSVGGIPPILVPHHLIPSATKGRPALVVLLYAMDGDKKQLFYSSEQAPGLSYYLEKSTGIYKMESGTTVTMRFTYR